MPEQNSGYGVCMKLLDFPTARARRMNRRDMLGGLISAGLIGGTPGWLGAAKAQQQSLPVIGLLDAVWGHITGEIGTGLRENGFEGKAFNIEYGHWTGTRPDYQAD